MSSLAATARTDDKVSPSDDIERVIARHIASSGFDTLPIAAVKATKEHILHTVATVMAGSCAPGVAELIEVLREFDGRSASTVIGWSMRVPPAYAAMANSLMGHAQDF